MTKFIAIKEEGNFKQQYKIVSASNRNYVYGRVRFETFGPKGAGWNVRCSECDEDLERLVRSKFIQNGRCFPLKTALELFAEANEELNIEYAAERRVWENAMEM